jgi:hypothetical protein
LKTPSSMSARASRTELIGGPTPFRHSGGSMNSAAPRSRRTTREPVGVGFGGRGGGSPRTAKRGVLAWACHEVGGAGPVKSFHQVDMAAKHPILPGGSETTSKAFVRGVTVRSKAVLCLLAQGGGC